jgi:hypothetical protein
MAYRILLQVMLEESPAEVGFVDYRDIDTAICIRH